MIQAISSPVLPQAKCCIELVSFNTALQLTRINHITANVHRLADLNNIQFETFITFSVAPTTSFKYPVHSVISRAGRI